MAKLWKIRLSTGCAIRGRFGPLEEVNPSARASLRRNESPEPRTSVRTASEFIATADSAFPVINSGVLAAILLLAADIPALFPRNQQCGSEPAAGISRITREPDALTDAANSAARAETKR